MRGREHARLFATLFFCKKSQNCMMPETPMTAALLPAALILPIRPANMGPPLTAGRGSLFLKPEARGVRRGARRIVVEVLACIFRFTRN